VITLLPTSERLAQSLTVELLKDARDLRRLGTEWSHLYECCADATPFQRPAWLLAWVDAFCPRDLLIVTVRDGGNLVGLAPLLTYRKGGQCILAFAGGGVSDYLGLLCAPGREADVVQSILACLTSQPNWDVLELTDIPGDSSLLKLPVFEPHTQPHDSVSVLPLPGDKNQLLHGFSRRQRANLRNAASRLLRAGGGRIESATTETLGEFLHDLFRLHTTRWSKTGQPGVLHDESTRNFHRDCAPDLHAQGLLKIHRMRLGEQTIAILYSLWEGETVFAYMQGFDPAYASLSPGTQLMFAVIEEAQSQGFRTFDFLRGQEAYKQHWRAQLRSTFRVSVNRTQLAEPAVAS